MTPLEKTKIELYRSIVESEKEEINKLYKLLEETLKELQNLVEKANGY